MFDDAHNARVESQLERIDRMLDQLDVTDDVETILVALDDRYVGREAALAALRLVLALWLDWARSITDTNAPGGNPEAS
jgi:hypothetical protein